MEFETTYTLTDVADKLGRSRTSVNEWVHLFKEYIEPHVIGKGRTKRYKETVLPVLALIERLKNEGQPNEYIRNVLGNGGNESIIDVSDNVNTPYLTQMSEAFNYIKNEMEVLKRQNEALQEEMEAMKQAAVTIEQRNHEREERLIEREQERQKEQREQDARFERLFNEIKQYQQQQEPKGFFAKLFGK
jgi:DNA-binding transcriptional MerR regulator